jgi:hypothetical protein
MADDGIPVAAVVHTVAGRTRLRIASHAGRHEFFEALAAELAAQEGIRSVRVRPLTGTVVVAHDGSLDSVVERAAAKRLFLIDDSPEGVPGVAAAPVMSTAAAGAMAMGTLGVVQLFRDRVLPPALTLFWYALSLAREARGLDAGRDEPD